MIVKSSLRSSVTAFALTVCFLHSATALAQTPDEVAELAWCPDSAACLLWSPVDGADGYTLYRGDLDGVQGVASNEAEPCVAGAFAEPTSGSILGDPVLGGGHWYLVAASNASGDGSTGNGSQGPRVVVAGAECGAGGSGALVLNEVDYDQTGADTEEFVEIVNAGTAAADLTGVQLVFVNGSNESEYARVDLSGVGSLAPGSFLVVGAAAVLAGLPAGVVGLSLPGSLQNGSPDGVALYDAGAGVLLDALSYEGEIRAATITGAEGTFDLVEGAAATAEDSGDGSLIRLPDGRDTDDAATDWSLGATPTPGAANSGN